MREMYRQPWLNSSGKYFTFPLHSLWPPMCNYTFTVYSTFQAQINTRLITVSGQHPCPWILSPFSCIATDRQTVTWTDHLQLASRSGRLHCSTLHQCRLRTGTGRRHLPHRKGSKPPKRKANFTPCWNSRAAIQLSTHDGCWLQVPVITIHLSPFSLVFHLQCTSTRRAWSHQPDSSLCTDRQTDRQTPIWL